MSSAPAGFSMDEPLATPVAKRADVDALPAAAGEATERAGDRTQCAASQPPAAPRWDAASRVLRGAGSFALVAALSTFLWQHWQSGSDLVRAAALLAHTLALAGAGLFCGLRARDGKAARTFVGLAGASLPILAAVGGGLVYSQFAWDSAREVSGYASWVAPSAGAALAAGAVALLATLPVAFLSMGVFARRAFVPLATASVLGNALLLVPTRQPDAIAALVAVCLAGLVALEWRVLRHEASLRTLEGGLARALVVAPPLFLVARSALHYDVSPLLQSLLWFSTALGLTAFSLWPRIPESLRMPARWAALLPAAWASVGIVESAVDLGLGRSVALPISAAGFAVQLWCASLQAGAEPWGRAFRRLAAGSVSVACVWNLALAPGVVASLLAATVSLVMLAWGTLKSQRELQWLGAAGALAAVAVHVKAAIALYAWSRWGSLALLGVLTIFAASWVERSGPQWLQSFEAWKRRQGQGEEA